MNGEKKIIDMRLEYGVRIARAESMGTGIRLGPSSSAAYDSSVPIEMVKAQAEALGNLVFELAEKAAPPALKEQFFVELEHHLRLARSHSVNAQLRRTPGMENSTRKRFLRELIKQFNPALLNNDAHDIGSAVGLNLDQAESVARELEQMGFVEFLPGIGGMIAPTDAGKKAAADADWQ